MSELFAYRIKIQTSIIVVHFVRILTVASFLLLLHEADEADGFERVTTVEGVEDG